MEHHPHLTSLDFKNVATSQVITLLTLNNYSKIIFIFNRIDLINDMKPILTHNLDRYRYRKYKAKNIFN